MAKGGENARNYSQCDSLLIGDKCGAYTFLGDRQPQPHGCGRTRSHDLEDFGRPAVLLQPAGPFDRGRRGLIVNGYACEVLAKLPMEFAVEAQKLSLEGSVG